MSIKNKCDNFNSSFYKISSNEPNIIDILNDKLACDETNGFSKRFKKDNSSININDAFKSYRTGDPIYATTKNPRYLPVVINTKTFSDNEKYFEVYINTSYVNYKGSITGCNICDLYNIDGFNDTNDNYSVIKYMSGLHNLYQEEIRLIYKNFVIIQNYSPYMSNHLMIITTNHEKNNVKGTQYEILNREILEEIVDFYNKISSTYFMGHNFANVGSQLHFHIHTMKKNNTLNYGYDNMLNDIVQDITNYLSTITDYSNNIKNVATINSGEINYTLYINKNSKHIYFVPFYCPLIGYRGYLVSILKTNYADDFYRRAYITALSNILNHIQNDSLYTFTLYFGLSDNSLNIVILSQQRKNLTSFRNTIGFIFTNGVDRFVFDTSINSHAAYIKKYIKNNIIPDNTIYDLLENKIPKIKSVYGDSSLRFVIPYNSANKYKNHTNEYVYNLINKPSYDEPKLIIVNSSPATGKSLLIKNMKKYFNFYDEETFFYLSVDEIIYNIPYYKEKIDNISKVLKNKYWTKPFNTYSFPTLSTFGDYSISDLYDLNVLKLFKEEDFEHIYDEIFNNVEPEISDTETVYNFTNKIFSEISTVRQQLLNNFMNICKANKYNVLLETARLEFDGIKNIGIGTTYKSENVYYLGYNTNSKDPMTRRFILRNCLVRNIIEGRLLSVDFVMKALDGRQGVISTYKSEIEPENFILISLDLKMKKNKIKPDLNLSAFQTLQIDCDTITINPSDVFKDMTRVAGFSVKNNFAQTVKLIRYMPDAKNLLTTVDESSEIKKYLTNINNDYLITENNMTIMIYNTVSQINALIEETITLINTKHSLTVSNAHIKLVLKGGLNMRILLKQFFSSFVSNININDDKNKDKQELKKIIESMDTQLEIDNVFKNAGSKSDIDFLILIDKTKITSEAIYTEIVSILTNNVLYYLFELKIKLSDTNFFGSGSNISNIKYDPAGNVVKVVEKNKQSIVQSTITNFKFSGGCSETASSVLANTKSSNFFTANTPKFKDDNYYISYIKDFETTIVDKDSVTNSKIDILRLKNSYEVTKNDGSTISSSGELIDIVLFDFYNSAGNMHNDNIITIDYLNNVFDFKFNIFDNEYILKDLINLIFGFSLYPWSVKKIEKRIGRLVLFIIINNFIKAMTDETLFVSMDSDMGTDFTLYFAHDNMNDVSRTNIFFDLIHNINKLKYKIDLINSNLPKYKDLLTRAKFEFDVSDGPSHYLECLKEYRKFIKDLSNVITKGIELYKILKKFYNQQIKGEIVDKFVNNKINLLQWGGFNKVYANYKKYYMDLKGGRLGFVKNGSFYKISGFAKSHEYTENNKIYIEYFLSNILPNININKHAFTSTDIDNIQPLGCGSFGCGFLINNSTANKKLIIKIIEANAHSNNKVYDEKTLGAFIKESYVGFYVSQFENFNQIYGYFKTSNILGDIYYQEVKNSTIEYSGRSHLNDFKYAPDELQKVLDGDVFIILMDAGDNNLSGLIADINTKFAASDEPTLIKKCNILKDIFKQMLNIYKSPMCYNVSKKCVYLTHNDLKPDNIIFKFISPLVEPHYKIEYIDYGGCLFSENFFNNIKVSTPILRNLVSTSRITSPLYDIASAIYTMFFMIFTFRTGLLDSSTHFGGLQRIYTSAVINISTLNTELNYYARTLYGEFESLPIFSTHAGLFATNDELKKLAGLLVHYLNFALCIRRYMEKYMTVINANPLEEIDFTNFQIVKFNDNKITPNAVSVYTYSDLKNNDLLKRIVEDFLNSISNY